MLHDSGLGSDGRTAINMPGAEKRSVSWRKVLRAPAAMRPLSSICAGIPNLLDDHLCRQFFDWCDIKSAWCKAYIFFHRREMERPDSVKIGPWFSCDSWPSSLEDIPAV
jgi:hypothetical protein